MNKGQILEKVNELQLDEEVMKVLQPELDRLSEEPPQEEIDRLIEHLMEIQEVEYRTAAAYGQIAEQLEKLSEDVVDAYGDMVNGSIQAMTDELKITKNMVDSVSE